MKKLHTLVCVVCMTLLGGFLASVSKNEAKANSYNTISAAPVLHLSPQGIQLPLDLQLDLEKKYNRDKPTEVIHDTVYVDTPNPKKGASIKRKKKSTASYAGSKRKGDSIPAFIPDVPMPDVDVGREENTTDTIGTPKVSIILIVDGKEVYKR